MTHQNWVAPTGPAGTKVPTICVELASRGLQIVLSPQVVCTDIDVSHPWRVGVHLPARSKHKGRNVGFVGVARAEYVEAFDDCVHIVEALRTQCGWHGAEVLP